MAIPGNRQPPPPGQTEEVTRYFRVERQQMVYLKFILEAYEGLATLSTADQRNGIVSLTCPISFASTVNELVAALGTEIALTELAKTEFLSNAS